MSHMFLFVGLWSLLCGYGVWRFAPQIINSVRKRLPTTADSHGPRAEGVFDLISMLQQLVFRGVGVLGMAGGAFLLITYVCWLFGLDVFALVL